jgi:hypothetical protein
MTTITSWQSSIVPPGHCVPGIPVPRPLPPYSYLYTSSSGTTTWQVPLAAALWSPAALPVPATLSRLYRYRYGYAAGPLGVQRTPGSYSLPLVPVPLLWSYRYGYVAGHLREQRKNGQIAPVLDNEYYPLLYPLLYPGPLDLFANLFTGVAC